MLGVNAKQRSHSVPQCSGGGNVGELQVHESLGLRKPLEPQSSRRANCRARKTLPRQQLVWLIAGDLCVPFDRGSGRSGSNPMGGVISGPANLPQMRQELGEIGIVA